MTTRRTPHAADRQRDELCLHVLNLWDAGWSAGEIAREACLVSRNSALGIVHRVNDADPEALQRKPERKRA